MRDIGNEVIIPVTDSFIFDTWSNLVFILQVRKILTLMPGQKMWFDGKYHSSWALLNKQVGTFLFVTVTYYHGCDIVSIVLGCCRYIRGDGSNLKYLDPYDVPACPNGTSNCQSLGRGRSQASSTRRSVANLSSHRDKVASSMEQSRWISSIK